MTLSTFATLSLLNGVKAHAVANYEQDGWDIVTECYTDTLLLSIMERTGATTLLEAVAAVKAYVKPHNDYREDIEGS